jgi:hypothetical protein
LAVYKTFCETAEIIVDKFCVLTQHRSEDEIPDLQKLAVVLFGSFVRGFSN